MPSTYDKCRQCRARRLIAIVMLGVTLGLFHHRTGSAADFDAGWQAYQQGDFLRAFKEWQPLAENGDKRAQLTLLVNCPAASILETESLGGRMDSSVADSAELLRHEE